MSEESFDVVFFGILQTGKDKDAVIQNMAKLFKTEPKKLAPFFAGGRKVIKKNLTAGIAEKYKAALENVGLVVNLEAHETPVEFTMPEAPADKPVTAKATQSSPATAQSQAKPASDTNANTDKITIAELGADVLEHPVEVIPQKIGDISDISMAEIGVDVLEHPVEVVPQKIDDISDISMAEAGVDVLEHPVEVVPQKIDDISDISMAEVGVDVLEHPKQVVPQEIEEVTDVSIAEAGADIIENPKPKEKAPIPDISGLSLAKNKE